MLSEATTAELREQAIAELECFALNAYTPMSRDEWERNRAIADRLLDDAFGA